MTRQWLAVVVLGLALPSASAAQSVELSGFGGWRFGGSGRDPISAQQADIAGAWSFGGAAGLGLGGSSRVELYFSRAESGARRTLTDESLELALSYLQLGYVFELGRPGGIRPFVSLALGGARIRHGTGESKTRASLGAGIGARLFPTRHLGLRAEARLLMVLDDEETNRSRSLYTGGTSRSFGFQGETILQGELTLGLVLAF